MRKIRQLYGKERSFRLVTVYVQDDIYDVELVTGMAGMEIQKAWDSFGKGGIVSALSTTGRERWYRGLTREQVRARLKIISSSAEKSGMKNYGSWE